MAVFASSLPPALGSGQVENRYVGTQLETGLDDSLERAIDRVGRDKVFARARAVGWSSDTEPPKWVWQMIVAELETQGTC